MIADVVELGYTLVSGTKGRKLVRVRVSPSAPPLFHKRNSKFEILNSKQITIPNFKFETCLEFGTLEFRICFEFRASNFEFLKI